MTVGICSLILLWRYSGRSFQLMQVALLILLAAGLYATLTRSVCERLFDQLAALGR